ncbi:MAG: DUF5985 family protein [Bdellovibrionota bacterium]
MAELVYFLCALMSTGCAIMLFRGFRKARSRLLLWSCLSFCFLAVNNVILFTDAVILPTIDFGGVFLRATTAAIAGSLLLFGLIWEIT